jgi:ADP-heptose:LPS heptosyltransferase
MRSRRLERAVRALLVRWAAALDRRAPDAATPGPRPVLYLRYDRIGDMILATGLLRALAGADPPCAVDVLASPENAPVLDGNPHVRSVILFDRRRPLSYWRTLRRVRRARYAAVLDCQVFSPSTTTLLMMLASGARWRVGVANRGIDAALTHPVPVPASARHIIEYSAALAVPFGVDPARTDWRPELFLGDAERTAAELQWTTTSRTATASDRRRVRLLVNISAGKASCRWTEAGMIALLQWVAERERPVTVLLISAPSDSALAERIAAATGVARARTPRMRDALALVATADLVVTPDTSITHAASAFDVPALVLAPRGKDAHWGPYRTAGRSIASPGRWVDSITVEAVRDGLAAMLDASVAEPTRRP